MSGSAQATRTDPMTVEAFLDWEDGTDTRYELLDGQPIAMAPPLSRHALLLSGCARELSHRVKRPCRVYSGVGVRLPHDDTSFFEADVAVGCGRYRGDERWVPDPVLIVEVLSPSTFDYDKGRKAEDYRRIDSVQHLLFVDPDRRHAQLWTRNAAGWQVTDHVGATEVPLTALAVTLPLQPLWDDIEPDEPDGDSDAAGDAPPA